MSLFFTNNGTSLTAITTAEQHFATNQMGTVAFNATSGVVTLPIQGGLAFIWENPLTSKLDLYLSRVALTADTTGRFERYRNGKLVLGSVSPVIAVNRGGGKNVPHAKGFAPISVNANSGVLGKVQYLATDTTDKDEVNGGIIIKPGQNLYWLFIPKSGQNKSSCNCSVEVVWWEKWNA